MRTVVVFLLSLVLAGCAGKDFVKPPSDSFSLGSTTYDQIVKTYGDPRRTMAHTSNGISLKTVTYSYSVAVPFTTKLSSRAMVLVFEQNALVSYDYISSFDDDKQAATLDEERVKQIAQGDSKKKVLAILGPPGGEAIFPVASPKGHTLLRYSYMETYRVPFLPTPRITRKLLTIKFDSTDTVVDIASEETKPG